MPAGRIISSPKSLLWRRAWFREPQIAQAGFEFITGNLRYDDVKAYWRKLLIDYSKLLKYTVTKAADTSEISTKNHKVVDKK